MSAFRESQRSHPRSQLLSLTTEHAQSRDNKPPPGGSVSNKPDTINEDGSVYEIDLATCIVGDLSSDIFSNIEKLNLSEKYMDEVEKISVENTDELNKYNASHEVTLHIEDETDQKKATTKCDPDIKDGTNYDNERYKTEQTLLERRRVSLPEITTIPNMKAIRIK